MKPAVITPTTLPQVKKVDNNATQYIMISNICGIIIIITRSNMFFLASGTLLIKFCFHFHFGLAFSVKSVCKLNFPPSRQLNLNQTDLLPPLTACMHAFRSIQFQPHHRSRCFLAHISLTAHRCHCSHGDMGPGGGRGWQWSGEDTGCTERTLTML